jgi:lysophospholipase L1-like esterase
LRRFLPSLPEEFRSNPRWSIQLNSRGDRDIEIADHPQPSTIRIACIGDSWTFGMNVNQDQTYPSRLIARLLDAKPDQRFEVVNFGVLGYSSLQGLRLLKERVLALHPNIVVIGFAMNDSEVAGSRDKDNVNLPGASGLARIKEAAEAFESFKLLNYLALTVKFHPRTIADYLKEEARAGESGAVNYDELEAWTRVSPHDYDANMREMIRLARASRASVVLLDNELWGESPYRPVLRKISSELDVPLIDSYAIIENTRNQIQQDLEKRLDLGSRGELPPRAADGVTIVFRVLAGSFPVPTRLSIVGTDPQLGALSPNTIALHDDATNGDQRAGDGVWSYAATFRPGARISYVYTNSGRPGQWEGLDLPHIRSIQVPAVSDGRPIYLPIETFGRIYMQADNWHTDRVGYDLIARAVADAILRSPHP